jgi:hypothetical protein
MRVHTNDSRAVKSVSYDTDSALLMYLLVGECKLVGRRDSKPRIGTSQKMDRKEHWDRDIHMG